MLIEYYNFIFRGGEIIKRRHVTKRIFTFIMSLLIVSTCFLNLNLRKVSAEVVSYEDFYTIDSLPQGNVNLNDTFQLVKPIASSGGDVNKGPSIDGSRSDIAIITQDSQWQYGAIWYKNKISLKKDFSMNMYVNLGSKWDNGNFIGTHGGDGITFTIHGNTDLSNTLGANGAGLGAYSKDNDVSDPYNALKDRFIDNALILEFNTFYNNKEINTNDNNTPNFGNGGANGSKFYGHLDITETYGATSTYYKKHGVLPYEWNYFKSPADLQNAVNQDLTDQRWRKVSVIWDSTSLKLTYNIAGYSPIVYQFADFNQVITMFGSEFVYWGFTGSTGGATNKQQVSIFEVPDQTETTFSKKVRNITKKADAEFVESSVMKNGDTLEYEITLLYPAETNEQDMIGAYIEDKLPVGLTYVADSLSVKKNGTDMTPMPSWNDGVITLGDISPGNTFVIRYKVITTEEAVIDNTAVFRSKYTNQVNDGAQVYSGSLDLSKVDENGLPLVGSQFTLTSSNGYSQMVPQNETDKISSFHFDYLEPGTYTLVETRAPEGYQLLANPITFEVTTEESTHKQVFEVANRPKPILPNTGGTGVGLFLAIILMFHLSMPILAAEVPPVNFASTGSITITKTGDGGVALPGVVYELQKTDELVVNTTGTGSELVADLEAAIQSTTNASGIASFPGLALGRYTLKEVSAPNHLIDPTVYVIDVPMTTSDGTQLIYDVEVQPKNEKISGSVTFKKVGEGTDASALAGATFHLFDSTNVRVDAVDYVSGIDGVINVTGLDSGSYYFQEVTPAPGYLINTTKLSFDITVSLGASEQPAEVDLGTFNNYKTPEAFIEQKDANETTWTDSTTTLPGETVEFRISTVAPGDISEYNEFALSTTIKPELDFTTGTVTVYLNDTGTTLVEGVDYVLTEPSEGNGNKLTVELTPTGIGKVNPGDTFYVEYETVVNDTAIPGTPITSTADVNWDNNKGSIDSDVSTPTNTDVIVGEVTITKVDKTSGDPLSGATFMLQQWNGSSWVDVLGKTTDVTGILSWSNLENGSYRLVETKAPTGYKLLANPIEFTIDGTNNTRTFTIENIKMGILPQTGGIGTLVFTLTGLLLMAVSVVLLLKNRKKTEN